MKYLKLYENFEDINQTCQKYHIKNYTINQDGSIDVDGDVNLRENDLSKLPFKFGKVNGSFNCSANQLISLKGCPVKVGSGFACASNKLTTLIGGPKIIVYGIYNCERNKLTDVYGFPEQYNHNFNAHIYLADNPVNEITELCSVISMFKFIKWINEYDVIREGKFIVQQRLEEAYWMATKIEKIFDDYQFKNYTLI